MKEEEGTAPPYSQEEREGGSRAALSSWILSSSSSLSMKMSPLLSVLPSPYLQHQIWQGEEWVEIYLELPSSPGDGEEDLTAAAPRELLEGHEQSLELQDKQKFVH